MNFNNKKRLLLLLLLPIVTLAQKQRTKADYVNVIHKFYSCLLSDKPITVKDCSTFFDWEGIGEMEEYVFYDNCNKKHVNKKLCDQEFNKYYHGDTAHASMYFIKIKEQASQISFGLNEDNINNILIDSSYLIDFGEPSYVLIRIAFPDKKDVYFAMNKYSDEQANIGSIFLPDGSSSDNKIYPANKRYLELIGKINDHDGFINIRKNPSVHSSIISTINKGEQFYYTPQNNSQWWRVTKKGNPTIKGYVFYDRVLPDTETKERGLRFCK